MALTVKYVKIHPKAVTPKKEMGNLAFDLHVVRDDDFRTGYSGDWQFTLHPWQAHIFHTGLKIALPEGFGAVYRDRSGMGAKHNIHVLAGCIDNSYRGEWMICLMNLSQNNYVVYEGDRIVQAILVEEYSLLFEECKELDATFRGEKGFGSSGR